MPINPNTVSSLYTPLYLVDSKPLDAKFKINSLLNIQDIAPAYVGHIFYSVSENKHYKVTSIKNGYFHYSSSSVQPYQPLGLEYVQWELVPDYYIDTYEEFGAGGSTETPQTIKTKYESNADTNAYTDAEKTKLTGIEVGAQVNPTFKTVGGQSITGAGDIPVNVAFNLQSDSIATYANLPTGLNNTTDVNKAYYVQSDKLVYVWDGTAFPLEGNGIDFKGDDDVRQVLQEFLEGSAYVVFDYSTSVWQDALRRDDGSNLPNIYNKSITIPISNINKFRYQGRLWQSGDQPDIDTTSTVLGKKSDGTYVQLLPAVLSPAGGGLVPIGEYEFDSVGIVELYINRANDNTYIPILSKLFVETDAVKKEIVRRTPEFESTFNVLDYKLDSDIDDRLCIQRAINDCFVKGGGKVFFPERLNGYNLGSSLTSREEVVNGLSAPEFPLAQLIIPNNEDTSKLITIEFEGAYIPNFAEEAIVPVGKSNRNVIQSQRIATTNDGSAIIASCWTPGGTYSGKSYIQIVFRNLHFRNNTISSGVDVENKMNGIDMQHVTQFLYDYIKVDISSLLYNAVEPTSSVGILMPSVNNKVQNGEGSSYIAGYYSGLRLGEHFNAKRYIVLGCINGIEFPDTVASYHSASIVHLNIEACRNMIKMQNSNQVLNIFNYDVEHHNDVQKWYNYQFDILKTGGSGVVNIFNAQVVKSFIGNVNEFIVSGNPDYKVFSGVGVTP